MRGKELFFLLLIPIAPRIIPAPTAFAQDKDKAELQVEANTVLVDVVVTDKKGRSVHGLEKKDFAVSEDGKRQTVDYFEEHEDRKLPAGAVLEMPKMPPHVYSNVPLKPASDAVDVVLLDGLNSEFQDQSLVHNQVIDFFRTRPPGTQMAIFHLGAKLDLVQGFTSDASTLLSAITAGDKDGQPRQESLSKDADSVAGNMGNIVAKQKGATTHFATANENNYLGLMKTDMTLEALEYLGRYLTGIPGRKNLIWFSSSYPISLSSESVRDTPGIGDVAKKTLNALTKARVAIYPIGAQGVMTENILDASNAAPPGSVPVNLRPQGGAPTANIEAANTRADTILGMNQIASDTGGKAYYNSNDLAGELQRAESDGAAYYTVAYSPTNKKMDGRFRKIEVKVEAGSTYKLSYREGYFGSSKTPEADQLQADSDPLKPLMKYGLPGATQILFAVRALPALAQPTAHEKLAGENRDLSGPLTRYALDYFIRWTDISLVPGPHNTHDGKVQLETLAWDQKTGKAVNWEGGTMETHLQPATYTEVQKSGLPAHMNIDLPKGDLILVTGVYDWTTGKAGTLEIPLHVEDRPANSQAPSK